MSMDDTLAAEFGARVRFARRRSRQTQAVVAGLSGISTDYLYLIERGRRLPAVPVVVRLARVLNVSVAELLGETPRTNLDRPSLEAGEAIGRALTEPLTHEARPGTELDGQVHAAWQRWQSSPHRYSQLGSQLPPLITATERARQATTQDSSSLTVQRRAADLYSLVRTVAKRVGRVDLALLAADRGLAAAENADDPIRLAAARWNLAHVLLAQGRPASAEAVAVHAAEAIAPQVGDDLNALAVQGSLRLISAMASVRQGAVWAARDRVRSVAPMAERTGECNACWTAFGPTNVAMYAVSVEVEAGETSEALRLAERINPGPSLSIERRVAFHLEQAKGYNHRRDHAGALVMLQAARVEAPEDLKYRPAARAALKVVVRRARGNVARQAARLAGEVGVPVA